MLNKQRHILKQLYNPLNLVLAALLTALAGVFVNRIIFSDETVEAFTYDVITPQLNFAIIHTVENIKNKGAVTLSIFLHIYAK